MESCSQIKEILHHLDEYLLKLKTVVDELGAIGKALSEDRQSFWLLRALGSDYQNHAASTSSASLI